MLDHKERRPRSIWQSSVLSVSQSNRAWRYEIVIEVAILDYAIKKKSVQSKNTQYYRATHPVHEEKRG